MNITNDKLMEILERNLGLPMGDGGIFYIEDPGQKRINKIYFSKNNMSLYKCTADNTDVTVTGNFKLYSLSNTDDYLGALTGVDRGQVKYIQDVGTKYVDKVYIDRPTGKLYRCVTQTSSVNNDANFVENNLKSTDDTLYDVNKYVYVTTQELVLPSNATSIRQQVSIDIVGKMCRLSFRFDDLKINANFSQIQSLRYDISRYIQEAHECRFTVVNNSFHFEIAAYITKGMLLINMGRGGGSNLTIGNAVLYFSLDLFIKE